MSSSARADARAASERDWWLFGGRKWTHAWVCVVCQCFGSGEQDWEWAYATGEEWSHYIDSVGTFCAQSPIPGSSWEEGLVFVTTATRQRGRLQDEGLCIPPWPTSETRARPALQPSRTPRIGCGDRRQGCRRLSPVANDQSHSHGFLQHSHLTFSTHPHLPHPRSLSLTIPRRQATICGERGDGRDFRIRDGGFPEREGETLQHDKPDGPHRTRG